MMINKPINEVIEQIIKERNISLEKIAADIGVTSMTIYRWKRGQTIPKSQIILNALSKYINKSLVSN